jgi:hypothetical protein
MAFRKHFAGLRKTYVPEIGRKVILMGERDS